MALDNQVIAARLAALDQYLSFLAESARLDLSAFTSDPRNYAAAGGILWSFLCDPVLRLRKGCRVKFVGKVPPTL